MEILPESAISRLVGLGTRVDTETGRSESIVNFYPSVLRNVIRTFELAPINKYYGLTVETAMNLPFDEWQEISKSAMKLAENQPPDTESKLFELLKELLGGRGEGS